MNGIDLSVELDEALYLALRLRAAREQAEPDEVVTSILRGALPGELAAPSTAFFSTTKPIPEPNVKGIELNVELDEALYLALRLRAARERVEPAEVVRSILRGALTGELAVARGAPPLDSVIRYIFGHHGEPSRAEPVAAFHYK